VCVCVYKKYIMF